MFYGIYKNIRGSSWRCLDDFKIDSLPVDIIKIARSAGIKVVRNSLINALGQDELGRSFYDGGEWIIVYDDSKSAEISRYTIAHELGHIFLGHELKLINSSFSGMVFEEKAKSEKQADMFAVRILCPACVLWGLNLSSAEEIASFCRIDSSVAKKRAKRMQTLYKRQMFLTCEEERIVFDKFKGFISNNTTSQEKDFDHTKL